MQHNYISSSSSLSSSKRRRGVDSCWADEEEDAESCAADAVAEGVEKFIRLSMALSLAALRRSFSVSLASQRSALVELEHQSCFQSSRIHATALVSHYGLSVTKESLDDTGLRHWLSLTSATAFNSLFSFCLSMSHSTSLCKYGTIGGLLFAV